MQPEFNRLFQNEDLTGAWQMDDWVHFSVDDDDDVETAKAMAQWDPDYWKPEGPS